jgi:hypothetical protein
MMSSIDDGRQLQRGISDFGLGGFEPPTSWVRFAGSRLGLIAAI